MNAKDAYRLMKAASGLVKGAKTTVTHNADGTKTVTDDAGNTSHYGANGAPITAEQRVAISDNSSYDIPSTPTPTAPGAPSATSANSNWLSGVIDTVRNTIGGLPASKRPPSVTPLAIGDMLPSGVLSGAYSIMDHPMARSVGSLARSGAGTLARPIGGVAANTLDSVGDYALDQSKKPVGFLERWLAPGAGQEARQTASYAGRLMTGAAGGIRSGMDTAFGPAKPYSSAEAAADAAADAATPATTPAATTDTPAATPATATPGAANTDAAREQGLTNLDFSSSSPHHRALAAAQDTLRNSSDSVQRDAARKKLENAVKYRNNATGFKGDAEHALNNIRIKQHNGQPLDPGEQQFIAKYDAWKGGDREAFSGGGSSDAAVKADADAKILREAKFNRMYGPLGSPRRQQQLDHRAATAASDRADAWVAQNREKILADYRARAAGQNAQPPQTQLAASQAPQATGSPGPYSPGSRSPAAGMPAATGFGNAMPTPMKATDGQLGAMQQAQAREKNRAMSLPSRSGIANAYANNLASSISGHGSRQTVPIVNPNTLDMNKTTSPSVRPAAPGAPQSLHLPSDAMKPSSTQLRSFDLSSSDLPKTAASRMISDANRLIVAPK